MSTDEKRLQELEDQAAELREKKRQIEEEAGHWKKQRDDLNEHVKVLRENALIEKQERDRINLRVADIKNIIRNLFQDMDDKREKLAEIEIELSDERSKLPLREKLEKKLNSIEWKLMTTPTMEIIRNEKDLIDEANMIRNSLEKHKKLDVLFAKKLNSLADSKAVELTVQDHRNEIKTLHEISQIHHEKMIQLFKTVDEERKKADYSHLKFSEKLKAIKSINEKLKNVMSELAKIRKEDREFNKKTKLDKNMELMAKRKELKSTVKQKLESGQKLDFEELRLLYDDEDENFDENP